MGKTIKSKITMQTVISLVLAILICEPILFAGTCRQYSKNAIPQENRITNISGQLSEMCICCSLR